MKIALIIGISGQDGSILANLLIKKGGYLVYGTSRNPEFNNFINLRRLKILNKIKIVSLNPENFTNIISIFNKLKPDEVYNLSGQTSVSKSFIQPIETFNSNFNTTINFLEAIRLFQKKIKYFNASSVEIFGNRLTPANEQSLYNPKSPYGISKAYSTNLIKFYRTNYDLFLCNGIFSNHESSLREENFVTKKIINTVWEISKGKKIFLEIGNLEILRDWGCAEEYMEVVYQIMQQELSDDFIIATGKSISLREFIDYTFKLFDLNYKKYIKINKNLYRKSEIFNSSYNVKKVKKIIGWSAKNKVYSVIDKLVKEKNKNI